MTVAELIVKLKQWPDQNARVVFTYASETDGDLVIHEPEGIEERLAYDDNGIVSEYPPLLKQDQPPIKVAELL